MSITNRYADNTYAAEAIAGFDAAFTTLSSQLTLPTADAAVVKRLARIGLKGGSFAREALDLAKLNTPLIPAGLNVARMEQNIANRDMLALRVVQVGQLYERLRAALVLHGVDAYADGRTVYNSLQRNGTDLSLMEAVARLGRMFKRGPKVPKDSLPADPTDSTGVTPSTAT